MPSVTIPVCNSSPSTMPSSPTRGSRSPSPAGPPYSPITPTQPCTPIRMLQAVPPVAHRPLVPFSESDNPDAIALRSAISILQVQRQNALRDIKTLERQKKIAVADPETFVKDLLLGNIKTREQTGAGGVLGSDNPEEEEDEEDHNDENATSSNSQIPAPFGTIPSPQSVVRCPPINWAKYHVVGGALERLHEEQTRRPTSGEPQRAVDNSRAEELVIAAPYRPWTDRLGETSMRTRTETGKETGKET